MRESTAKLCPIACHRNSNGIEFNRKNSICCCSPSTQNCSFIRCDEFSASDCDRKWFCFLMRRTLSWPSFFFFFQSNSFLVAARLCGQMGFGDCVWIRYAYDDISRNAQLANDRTWKNMGNYYVRMFWFAIDSSAVRNAERRLSLSLRVSSLATRPLLNCIKLMFSDSF